jgi:uncharacterized protein YmfQ (DUF2313 family)
MIRPGLNQPGQGLDTHDGNNFLAFGLGAWPAREGVIPITVQQKSLLRTLEHLLPKSATWKLSTDKDLRALLTALIETPADAAEASDLAFLDIFPATTRDIDAWEEQFGLDNSRLFEEDRRTALDAAWKRQGGQSPGYLQTTLRDAGFDVYVHEWWDLVDDIRVVRDPRTYITDGTIQYTVVAGNVNAIAGNVNAIAGSTAGPTGTLLVNKDLRTISRYTEAVVAGNVNAIAGNEASVCGAATGFVSALKQYTIPSNSVYWVHFWYVGAATFPEHAAVAGRRKAEFETLILKIKPAHSWVGLLINFV